MEFLDLKKEDIYATFNQVHKPYLADFLEYIYDVLNPDELKKLPVNLKDKRYYSQATKKSFIAYFAKILLDDDIKTRIHKKLTQTPISKFLYENLIWKRDFIPSEEVVSKFDFDLNPIINLHYGDNEEKLDDNLRLIHHLVSRSYGDDMVGDSLYIKEHVRVLLSVVFSLPDDYYLLASKNTPKETELIYSNENGVLEFISVIKDMLKSNLVEFGKTGEKPLLKTLKILQASTSISEFYSEKKMDTLAIDMLTRSFYYYFLQIGFKDKEIDALKDFTMHQLDDKLRFFISRVFTSHLKKVRFDDYYTSQSELFDMAKDIINNMPKNDWLSVDNILSYCGYRGYRFDFEHKYKTGDYRMDCDIVTYEAEVEEDELYVRTYYDIIFFQPVLKAVLFYLGSLGLLKLKYNNPQSLYIISAKGKPYISVWDSLEYIKLTDLGSYVFGFSESYTQKEIQVKKTKVKYDEYKPIITIEAGDSIMMAKLDFFCEKYDTNRYILSYNKIFKDCKNSKALELKIDNFYKQINKNPPKVFDNFFDEIKKSSNLLKRNLKQIVIELKNDKKLLELFMRDKKLKELIIKAEGYRVIILKEDMPKFSKIVKGHGFFIEF